MQVARWFFVLVAALFVPIAVGMHPSQAMDRAAQRSVMHHLHVGPIARPDNRADAAIKTYLTKLRDRYSSVLDRSWDKKYANHRNVKQWR